MKPAPPVTTNTGFTRAIVSPRHARPGGQRAPAASAHHGRAAETATGLAIFLARGREDVQHHAARVERAAAVGDVGRRLPEVAGLHVVLDPVLDADPLALQAHAPLLVGVRVHGRDGVRLQRDDGQHRVHAGEHAGGNTGGELAHDAALAEIVEARGVGHRAAPLVEQEYSTLYTIPAVGAAHPAG